MIGTYSPVLIALSYVVATVASHVALDFAGRVTAARGRTAAYWLVGGAVAMGIGIWSMHFIGMLAFHLPISMVYDRGITLASMLIAVIVSGFALFTVSRHTLTWQRLIIAGIAMGFGIAAMHYTGMAAMEIGPGIIYDPLLVTASVIIAIAASCAALWLAFQLRSESVSHIVWKKLGSAAIMGAAIVGMHYTGMAAAHFAAGTICTAPLSPIADDGVWLAAGIGAFAILLLTTMMLISVVDTRHVRQLEAAYTTISELAQTDALTGLVNRRAFLERLSLAFAESGRGGKPFALLLIDLDHFKDANDTFGHPAGDRLLRAVAERLRKAARQTDLVARLGGDEFAILQTGMTDPTDAATLASRIATLLGSPCTIDGNELRVTASIGIALSGAEVSGSEALMMRADLALYHAKDEGRNCFRLHGAHLDRDVHERVTLAEELAAGIARGELELVYEPQVELSSGRLIGLEALVRWNHPSRGLIMPSVFIPIAERAGSIGALGQWVIEEACRQLSRWHAQGVAPNVLAVNVSALQFKGPVDFAQAIIGSLDRWGISPGEIEIELTESVLMDPTQKHSEALARLRELGVRIAIDDFGTGYASLNYLTTYPVTRLKIAQELVSRAVTDHRSAVVVRAAIALAHELRIEVIAEGAETAAHASFLIEANCEQAQGYHFSQPITAERATKLLRESTGLLPEHRDPDNADVWPQHGSPTITEKAGMALLGGHAARGSPLKLPVGIERQAA